MKQRECGTCGLCCKLIGIKALEKPENTWCKHFEVGTGCLIYHVKPECCHSFSCLWLSGVIPDEFSPRKTGVVAVATKDKRLILYEDRKAACFNLKPVIEEWLRRGIDVQIVPPKSNS